MTDVGPSESPAAPAPQVVPPSPPSRSFLAALAKGARRWGSLIVATCAFAVSVVAVWYTADQEQRTLRPYLSVRGDASPVELLVGALPSANLIVEFLGRTPANSVTWVGGVQVAEYPLKTRLPDISHEAALALRNRSLLVSSNVRLSLISETELTEEQLAAIKDGSKQRLYVHGVIFYEDVFGAKHRTTFCMMFFGEPLKGIFCDTGNEAH